ncbi:hypothetical protein ACLOJK_040720 [Asimina triloba]
MRFVAKFGSFHFFASTRKIHVQPFISQRIHDSAICNSPNTTQPQQISAPEKIAVNKPETKPREDSSLFHRIRDIISAENLINDGNSSASEEAHIGIPSLRPQPVCGNSQKSRRDKRWAKGAHIRDKKKRHQHVRSSPAVHGKEKRNIQSGKNVGNRRKVFGEGFACEKRRVRILSVCENDNGGRENPTCEEVACGNSVPDATQLGNLSAEDVSLLVHRITEIVRAEDPQMLMEEHLEKLGIHYNAEIVEKVLKRCFKVGHLALRFFNWVKLRPGFHHTTETFNTMIYIAGEARQFNMAEKLLEEMCTESCPKNINTWTILISHYGKEKMIGSALSAFEEMRKSGCEPDEAAYRSIINALCNVEKAELAMEFYKEMVLKNINIDMKLYGILMCCLSVAGDKKSIRKIGDDMMKISEIPESEVYSCMLRSFCISGRIDEALELVDEVKDKNVMPDPENFKVLVKGLCRAGRVDGAMEFVNVKWPSLTGDGKVYEFIVNGYLRRGEFPKAFEVLNAMKESGYLPTVSTYTDVIQHLLCLNDYEKACEMYQQMQGNGIQPDAVAVTAMVAGHVQHGHISEAREAFDGMKKKGIGPTLKAYTVYIKELCKASQPIEAFNILNEMWASKITANNNLFHLVSSSLAKVGELEKAAQVQQMSSTFELYRQGAKLEDPSINHQHFCNESYYMTRANAESPTQLMKQELDTSEIQPSTPVQLQVPPKEGYSIHDLDEVCGILCSSQDWMTMQELLEKSTIHFTPELVVKILRCCQRHGHASLQFFSWVGQRHGYNHTAETYNMAIKISGSAKDFKHMRRLYHEMRRRELPATSDTWTIMITQYGRAGLTELALGKFKEMKAEGYKPNSNTYKYLIIFLCGKKGCNVVEAIKRFREMIHAGHLPDKELCEIYLSCLCEVGRLLDARQSFQLLSDSGIAMQTSYSLLVKALCRAGRLEEAQAMEDEMVAHGLAIDEYIYGSLIHGLLHGGRSEEALEKIESMKQSGIAPTIHVYTSLMVHFFREKQIGKALEMYNKMREDGCKPTVVTYSALIRGYMADGRTSEAWDVFHQMKSEGPFPDFKTYSMFITCLCRACRSEEALQLVHEMLETGILPSSINFKTVFYGLNREGKQGLARTVLQSKWALARRRKVLT